MATKSLRWQWASNRTPSTLIKLPTGKECSSKNSMTSPTSLTILAASFGVVIVDPSWLITKSINGCRSWTANSDNLRTDGEMATLKSHVVFYRYGSGTVKQRIIKQGEVMSLPEQNPSSGSPHAFTLGATPRAARFLHSNDSVVIQSSSNELSWKLGPSKTNVILDKEGEAFKLTATADGGFQLQSNNLFLT